MFDTLQFVVCSGDFLDHDDKLKQVGQLANAG